MHHFAVFITLLLLFHWTEQISSASQLSSHIRSCSSKWNDGIRGGAEDGEAEADTRVVIGVGSFHDDTINSIDIEKLLSVAHSMTITECLSVAGVSYNQGLSSTEALQRLTKYGKNSLTEAPSKSIFGLLFEQFQDRLVQILLGVAVLSGVLSIVEVSGSKEVGIDALVEPIVIVSILCLNAVVGIWQTKSAEDSLEALKKLQPDFACVLRNGEWDTSLPAQQIVPGDIIALKVGEKVPADARIISLKTNTFNTDEGSLTGESVTVAKTSDTIDDSIASISSKTNMVFAGTMVTNGGCYAMVVGTGSNSEIGKINQGVQLAKQETAKTPLTLKLDEFGDQLTKIVGFICLLVWGVCIPKFSSDAFGGSWARGALYHAKIAVALGVAAIPEGLPAVITLCLSLGTRRMASKKVIVRKLASVETLGCVSVICTDKTGTLTTNKMTVSRMVTLKRTSFSSSKVEDASIEFVDRGVDGVNYSPDGLIENFPAQTLARSSTLQLFASICSQCNEARIEYKDGVYERVGEPTEAALRVLVEKLGRADTDVGGTIEGEDLAAAANRYNDFFASKYNVLSILEFNRDRKSMGVLLAPTEGPSKGPRNVLFVKGASEMVAARCDRMQLEDGSIIPITAEIRKELMRKFNDMARSPLRCLAMAYKSGASLGELGSVGTPEEASSTLADPYFQASFAAGVDGTQSLYASIESGMTLVGFCGIKDPARPEAAEAILRCKSAGIRVMMITGDSKETAVAIARDVNIFGRLETTQNNAFTCKEFFQLPESVQLELLKSGNKVFCRAEPMDKQKLISLLDRLGEIPAMTGDGVNDAPALQQAAIGIAMGITGTEVAKGAADMVLADDNFSTIVAAVEEGRNIFANIQTFVCFLISCNIGEIVTIFIATLLGLPEPLTPLHLLWVNLVTDGPPATALGFNPSDPLVMTRSPRPKHESILSKWLVTRYIITGLYVGFATIGVFVWWYLDKGVSFSQLRHWTDCSSWGDTFAHSAEAPHWPKSPCDIFSSSRLKAKPQSLSLSVLVTIEMLKALSAVSLDSSLLTVQPWQNAWLILGVTVPFLLHILALYWTPLARVFGLSAISKAEWLMVLKFSLPIMLLEEILKFVGRRVIEWKEMAARKVRDAASQLDGGQHSVFPPPFF